MKIFTTDKMREWDAQTIAKRFSNSAELMESAAKAVVFDLDIMGMSSDCVIFCGIGNNGGDGLCLAPMLVESGYEVEVYIVGEPAEGSDDFLHYMKLLIESDITIHFLSESNYTFEIEENVAVIDCIFGIGINRPITGWIAELINHINALPNEVFAIDVPSGLQPDLLAMQTGAIIRAKRTFTFGVMKLAFMFAENDEYLGEIYITDIGLDGEFHRTEPSAYFYYNEEDVKNDFIRRGKFAHKGLLGHVRIMAGSKGKMGAAILASKAAMRAGAGLVTASIPACGLDVLQSAFPEAMCEADTSTDALSSLLYDENYTATAIGPGIGQGPETTLMLRRILKDAEKPLVLDADALNIIASKNLIKDVPKHSILTPHVKEFDRLFGAHDNSFERFKILLEKAKELQLIIVLKGANTAVAFPDGTVSFNSSGNQGMATAGSGDVLTGIIVSLLAQGYKPEVAARFGVYLHGNAGDLASYDMSMESMIASDIIDYLPKAYKNIHEEVFDED